MTQRGLSRSQAAAYLGVGLDLFDRGVAAGLLPQPRRLFDKRLWDLLELDRHFDELPHFTAADRKRDPATPSNDNPDAAVSGRDAWLAEVK